MSGKNFIVVPDGLATDNTEKNLPLPSFVYQRVLDWIVEHVQPQDVIYLAPANKFKGTVSEQSAAKQFLLQKISNKIVSFELNNTQYIDTRGNAIFLKQYLKSNNDWPLDKVILLSYYLHLPRASLVFHQEGFVFDGVPVHHPLFHPENIVPRLWYYKYPFIHRVYEFTAYMLFFLKIK